ncbi:hypothetical protein Tco_1196854 [Tanacetum coccineum]
MRFLLLFHLYLNLGLTFLESPPVRKWKKGCSKVACYIATFSASRMKEDKRETMLEIFNNQVFEPLRASIRCAPLEDARLLARNCDRLRQEVETQKEAISAMLSVEEQQQQVTLQKLILMVTIGKLAKKQREMVNWVVVAILEEQHTEDPKVRSLVGRDTKSLEEMLLAIPMWLKNPDHDTQSSWSGNESGIRDDKATKSRSTEESDDHSDEDIDVYVFSFTCISTMKTCYSSQH